MVNKGGVVWVAVSTWFAKHLFNIPPAQYNHSLCAAWQSCYVSDAAMGPTWRCSAEGQRPRCSAHRAPSCSMETGRTPWAIEEHGTGRASRTAACMVQHPKSRAQQHWLPQLQSLSAAEQAHLKRPQDKRNSGPARVCTSFRLVFCGSIEATQGNRVPSVQRTGRRQSPAAAACSPSSTHKHCRPYPTCRYHTIPNFTWSMKSLLSSR